MIVVETQPEKERKIKICRPPIIKNDIFARPKKI